MLRPQSQDEGKPSPFFEMQKVPPAKKGRNLKNLAVNTSRTTDKAPSLTGVPFQTKTQQLAPSILSPSFVKPPEPARRRPSNLGLTILTPTNIAHSPNAIRLAIPPTPSITRPGALRHFQSSPSLPLLTGFGNEGPKALRLGELDTIFSPIDVTRKLPVHESPREEDEAKEDEQSFEVPLSREEKPEAYPDGPICIYEPYVDLYLEPTAAQARQYDVVFNVASEVLNPLVAQPAPPSLSEQAIRMDGGGGIQYAPRRASADADTRATSNSPTTPKAMPGAFPLSPLQQQDPEYIHIKWEHNSDIVPDLLRLVKVVDEKVQQQKRILIHCQCGVSRSASLVVAYGLYKNPSLSVQEAYDAVKAKSKWIGPNMVSCDPKHTDNGQLTLSQNLIMQLQEFRSTLARGGVLASNRGGLSPITPTSALSEWGGPFSARSIDSDGYSGAVSAGLPPLLPSKSDTSVAKLPPTAPLSEAWSNDNRLSRARAASSARTSSAYVDPAGHIVPIISIVEKAQQAQAHTPLTPEPVTAHEEMPTPISAFPSPRAANFAMTGLTPAREVESDDSFGLMSPTSTGFGPSVFDRSTLLAQLGMTTHTQQALPVRTKSLHSTEQTQEKSASSSLAAPSARRLRGKISSPSLREQQHLQKLQEQIQAQLPQRQVVEHTAVDDDAAALMSPRATEFTQNPFSLAFDGPLAPAADLKPPVYDPRSPAHKGANPITRNIEDVL